MVCPVAAPICSVESVAHFAATGCIHRSGLIVSRGAQTITHRDLIVKLAAQHRSPAVYLLRLFVTAGRPALDLPVPPTLSRALTR